MAYSKCSTWACAVANCTKYNIRREDIIKKLNIKEKKESPLKRSREQQEKEDIKRRKKPGLKDDIFFLIFKLLLFLTLLGVMFFFVFGIERSSDYTMYPSVKAGDLVLYYRLQTDFAAGDVVIVKKDGKEEIRRIIAVPGDTVDITRDGLKINGYIQQENSIYAETLPYVEGITFPVTVGRDNYFVLADARLNTRDSRMYGAVKKEEIEGLVMTLIRRRGI